MRYILSLDKNVLKLIVVSPLCCVIPITPTVSSGVGRTNSVTFNFHLVARTNSIIYNVPLVARTNNIIYKVPLVARTNNIISSVPLVRDV